MEKLLSRQRELQEVTRHCVGWAFQKEDFDSIKFQWILVKMMKYKPMNEDLFLGKPELFRMPDSKDVTYQLKESRSCLITIPMCA